MINKFLNSSNKVLTNKKTMSLKDKIKAVLSFQKGYRLVSCVVWFLLIMVISIPIEKAMELDRESRAAKMDYQRFCAEGNFQAAHKVLNYYYSDYKDELGRWRSGEWRDRQALQAQENYHSVLAYIYGQEIASIFAGGDEGQQKKLLSLLIAIPTEGAPLSEGRHGNGMFFDNNAGVGETMAIDHVVYQTWVRFYNDRCEQLLDLALAYGDKAFALKVAKLYKTEVVTTFEQDTIKGDDYRIAIVSNDSSRYQHALEKINRIN